MNPREPVRLLEPDSEASDELRELLGAARLDEPSAEQLASLAGKLGPLLGPPGGAPPAAPAPGAAPPPSGSVAPAVASGVKAKVLTGVAVVVLAGGSFQAGRLFERERAETRAVAPVAAPTPPAPEPAREEAAPPEPAPPEPEPRPEPARPRGAAAPTPRVPRARAPEAPPLDEELALLEGAYQALQRGVAAEALAEAERHAVRFPSGALAQEREVLAIDALVRMGRRTEAEARAEAFRARYPTSTHWVRIQGLLSGTKP
ncbi:hypothetical protein [Cystobacter ferrugineus]|uniref:Uncharacterized protein n=1 Tax=Cystobacter ferrugineus TaxID=83449 RepID=A0A1L9BB92_9BACT|nr:hypothetical protein [Cystobacter ferrugineus]OJH39488.1 hypothetical protein BON30_18500 [Cystobacter ferrugineus]